MKKLSADAEYSRKRRAERIAGGLCVDCASPTKTGRKVCSSCAERRSKYAKDKHPAKPASEMHVTICEACGKEKKSWHVGVRFCSQRCRVASTVTPGTPHESTSILGVRGAIGELAVTVDLLKRGFEVFRNVSQHGSCDMVALKDGKPIRVEVRSASTNSQTGKVYLPAWDEAKADLLAVYTRDQILYIPALPS